jgi:hypothetical protein
MVFRQGTIVMIVMKTIILIARICITITLMRVNIWMKIIKNNFMNKEFLVDLMLVNTEFTLEEINEMEEWEILSYLGLD